MITSRGGEERPTPPQKKKKEKFGVERGGGGGGGAQPRSVGQPKGGGGRGPYGGYTFGSEISFFFHRKKIASAVFDLSEFC